MSAVYVRPLPSQQRGYVPKAGTFASIKPKPKFQPMPSNTRLYVDDHGDQVLELFGITPQDRERMIEGVISTGKMSHAKTGTGSLDPRGCDIRLPIPLRFGHESTKIGCVLAIRKSKHGIISALASINSSPAGLYAWKLIQRGEARDFSVGASHSKRDAQKIDGKTLVQRWYISELSVCRAGANEDARQFAITRPIARWSRLEDYEPGDVAAWEGRRWQVHGMGSRGHKPGTSEAWKPFRPIELRGAR
jgi:hypothetical protein